MEVPSGVQHIHGLFYYVLLCYYYWTLGKISSPEEWSKNGAGIAAQGGDGVTDPGGVTEMLRCCTEKHGLVGNTGGRWIVGMDDLEGLFQP